MKGLLSMSNEKIKKEPRYRVFNCLQYEVNPKTGESLNFDESNILNCIKHKTITRYAYIKHDSDIVTEFDVDAGGEYYTENEIGNPKGTHWHIVIEAAKSPLPISTIAKWLDIPVNMIKVPKGGSPFIDCVEYLRHSDIKQEEKGKYVYSSDCVKANFNWQDEVNALVLRKTKYGKPLSEESFLKNEVLYNGLTLQEVIEKNPDLYQREYRRFEDLRTRYILNNAPLPKTRVNFYIEGKSGYGKDTMARSIARALYNGELPKTDDSVYFEIGGNKVTFDGYDGQPTIIWSEFRAETFVKALGGYEEVLSSIDIIPKNNKHHKKYGSIRLINNVNIVTSTQPYEEFLKGLIPENDPDPTQANRRFPIIIPIRLEDFDILINSGYLDSDTYEDYTSYKNICGSFANLAKKLNDKPEVYKLEEKILNEPILEAHSIVNNNLHKNEFDDMSDDDIHEYFRKLNYGKVRSYRKKTIDELKIEYVNFLNDYFIVFPDSKNDNSYPTFEDWLKKYNVKKEILND